MDKVKIFLKKPIAWVVIGILAAVLIFAGFYGIFVLPHGTVAKGVTAGGVDLGGMSLSRAQAALLANKTQEAEKLTIYTASGVERSFTSEDIELLCDAEKTAQMAYDIGRNGTFFENMGTLLSLFFSPKDYGYEYSANEEKLGGILYELGVTENGELKNYVLDFGEGTVTVQPGIAGQSHDLSKEIEQFISGAEKGEDRILINFQKTQPPEPDIDSLFDEIYIAPQNARYEIKDGGVEFFADSTGRQIDKIEAGTLIGNLKNGEPVTLQLVTLLPDVTLEALNAQLFNHTLGEYSTEYAASNRNRSKNVELAASKINGVILAPGQEFSYNNIVGPRTVANGFKEAPVYENGETVQGLGGGVCQVSSTLYCAVLYSGLETTKRQNHSMTVGYVPKGQDATVSYGTIDYKFRNNTEFPVKILASAGKGKVTISISGTKPNVERTVKITNTVIETKAPTVTETPDPTLMTGNKKVVSKGKTGYTVESVRTFYENGIEVKTEKLNRSVYRMVPSKVAIGTKVPEPLPTLEPLPTPTPVPEPENTEVQEQTEGE